MSKKTHLSALAFLILVLAAVLQRTTVGKVLDAKVEEWRWYTASPYQVRLVSTDPFILHLEDFLTWGEQRYLLQLSKSLFQKSLVNAGNGSLVLDDYRTSSTAFLPRWDPVVRRVARRATELQGYEKPYMVEMQVTRYEQGQQYKAHYDAFHVTAQRATQRKSTIFAILEESCDHCGTTFPLIPTTWSNKDKRWCKHMDCDLDVLTTRSIAGSGLYWENLDAQGDASKKTRHAGLQLESGMKVGLNIWTHIPIKKSTGRTTSQPYM